MARTWNYFVTNCIDVFLKNNEIYVNSTLDTHGYTWSIAAGNYSSRFAYAVAGSAYTAAKKLKDKLKILQLRNLIVKLKISHFEIVKYLINII